MGIGINVIIMQSIGIAYALHLYQYQLQIVGECMVVYISVVVVDGLHTVITLGFTFACHYPYTDPYFWPSLYRTKQSIDIKLPSVVVISCDPFYN